MFKLKKYIDCIERMDALIRRKATGTTCEFAKTLNMSERRLYDYIKFMKTELNAPIIYNKSRKCYEYEKNGRLSFKWKIKK